MTKKKYSFSYKFYLITNKYSELNVVRERKRALKK